MMDTYAQVLTGATAGARKSIPQRQRWSVAEKRRIVEETLAGGTSVARVAREHGVNANQVFYWRQLYHKGRLGGNGTATLLPVRVLAESSPSATPSLAEHCSSGAFPGGRIHIELRHAQVRIEGSADPAVLRVLMECLQR